MNREQYQGLLNDILDCYDNYKQKYRREDVYPLSSDLEYFTNDYYTALRKEENEEAFNQLLDMHLLWITGNGNVKVNMNYKEKKVQPVNDWKQFSELVYERWKNKR